MENGLFYIVYPLPTPDKNLKIYYLINLFKTTEYISFNKKFFFKTESEVKDIDIDNR